MVFGVQSSATRIGCARAGAAVGGACRPRRRRRRRAASAATRTISGTDGRDGHVVLPTPVRTGSGDERSTAGPAALSASARAPAGPQRPYAASDSATGHRPVRAGPGRRRRRRARAAPAEEVGPAASAGTRGRRPRRRRPPSPIRRRPATLDRSRCSPSVAVAGSAGVAAGLSPSPAPSAAIAGSVAGTRWRRRRGAAPACRAAPAVAERGGRDAGVRQRRASRAAPGVSGSAGSPAPVLCLLSVALAACRAARLRRVPPVRAVHRLRRLRGLRPVHRLRRAAARRAPGARHGLRRQPGPHRTAEPRVAVWHHRDSGRAITPSPCPGGSAMRCADEFGDPGVTTHRRADPGRSRRNVRHHPPRPHPPGPLRPARRRPPAAAAGPDRAH